MDCARNSEHCKEHYKITGGDGGKRGYNWERVIVIEIRAVLQTWRGINTAINGWLEKEVSLVPFLNNKAFFECKSIAESNKLVRVGNFVIEGQPDLAFFYMGEILA